MYLGVIVQGYDGVDLEINLNGSKFGLQDDGFSDVVCCLQQLIALSEPYFLQRNLKQCN